METSDAKGKIKFQKGKIIITILQGKKEMTCSKNTAIGPDMSSIKALNLSTATRRSNSNTACSLIHLVGAKKLNSNLKLNLRSL